MHAVTSLTDPTQQAPPPIPSTFLYATRINQNPTTSTGASPRRITPGGHGGDGRGTLITFITREGHSELRSAGHGRRATRQPDALCAWSWTLTSSLVVGTAAAQPKLGPSWNVLVA